MIPLPKTIKEKEKKVPHISVFEISPLYPGYGVTVGNALRRVLLSSLEGAAITEVKIKGVSHEFSTISGVLEDVITILLNLKKLRFKLLSDKPQVIKLSASGEKEIKGKDFKLPPTVKLANSDLHIATLTSKRAKFELEAKIEKGVGYEPFERRKRKLPIGTIALDAIYSPVKRVAFKVENVRVGERTDFDKLTLEIETDGTLTPKEALLSALKVLIDHFSFLEKKLEK